MRPNELKKKLLHGEVVIGCGIGYPDPEAVEWVGRAGFDFVRFEGEHGPAGWLDVSHMVRACEVVGLSPTARVPGNIPHEILHYLDSGVTGITIPQVSSRAEAEAAVAAARHYPLGKRGDNGGGHLSWWGAEHLTRAEYYRHVNEETLVIALIETQAGLENVDEIVTTPGIDAIDVGPYDLAQSLGLPPQRIVDHAVDRIVEAAVRAGKPVGVGTAMSLDAPERISYFLDKGCTYFLTSVGRLFRRGAAEALRVLKEVQGAV